MQINQWIAFAFRGSVSGKCFQCTAFALLAVKRNANTILSVNSICISQKSELQIQFCHRLTGLQAYMPCGSGFGWLRRWKWKTVQDWEVSSQIVLSTRRQTRTPALYFLDQHVLRSCRQTSTHALHVLRQTQLAFSDGMMLKNRKRSCICCRHQWWVVQWDWSWSKWMGGTQEHRTFVADINFELCSSTDP